MKVEKYGVNDTQRHGYKISRIDGNGVERIDSSARLGDERTAEGVMIEEPKRLGAASALDLTGGVRGLYSRNSSRIVRVSRASGGKDRHSKVLTSKGLRDRRVRLSVNTAIQFYDLQDRLGYDQPSKALEWLLKAAASSIQELPPISCVFPGTPKQFTDKKRSRKGGNDELGFDAEIVANCGGDGGGGSPSITSEGSGLYLSRSESRLKARDRAKERVAGKQKEKNRNQPSAATLNGFSETTSFTELLSTIDSSNSGGDVANDSQFFQKSPTQWSSSPADCFPNGFHGQRTTTRSGHIFPSSPLSSAASPLFNIATNHSPEMQSFSFVRDAATGNSDSQTNNRNGGGEYNLNFTISSSPNLPGLTGFNRGTLQSNSTSPSVVPHLNGSPSFIGSKATVENQHQFLSGFDSRLQLYFGSACVYDNGRPSSLKEEQNN